jgi:hypothetical protein
MRQTRDRQETGKKLERREQRTNLVTEKHGYSGASSGGAAQLDHAHAIQRQGVGGGAGCHSGGLRLLQVPTVLDLGRAEHGAARVAGGEHRAGVRVGGARARAGLVGVSKSMGGAVAESKEGASRGTRSKVGPVVK